MNQRIAARPTFCALSSEGANLAKIVATFCVVFTHCYAVFDSAHVESEYLYLTRGFHCIGSCGLYIFFLLSGYFLTLKDNWSWSMNMKKKVKSLLIPYCLFMLVYTLLNCVVALALPGVVDDFREFTAYDWFMRLVGYPFYGAPRFYAPMWFLRDLFLLNVLSFLLVPAVKKTPARCLIPCMLILYFLPLPRHTRISVAFFVIGMCFGVRKRMPVISSSALIALLFGLGFVLPILVQGERMMVLATLLMAYALLSLPEKWIRYEEAKRITATLMPFSFPIYMLHEYPVDILRKVLERISIGFPAATAVFFLSAPAIIILCMLITAVWRRFLPKTFAAFTGGRR